MKANIADSQIVKYPHSYHLRLAITGKGFESLQVEYTPISNTWLLKPCAYQNYSAAELTAIVKMMLRLPDPSLPYSNWAGFDIRPDAIPALLKYPELDDAYLHGNKGNPNDIFNEFMAAFWSHASINS